MSDTRDTLIHLATEAIQRDGAHGLSFRTLGAQAGIRSASVHHHFSSKDRLLHAITVRYTQDTLAALAGLDGTAAQQLDGLVAIFADTLDQGRGCLCGVLASTPDQLCGDTRAALRDYFDALEAWSAPRLAALGQPGLAPILISALEGALLLDRLNRRQERLAQVRRWLSGLGGGVRA